MYLQINMVKYDTDCEITNICENWQIVWSQFFTNMLLFVYIQSTSNIYWFIGIQIRFQQIQMNSYSVTFDYSQYLVQHSMNDPEGKKTHICHYLYRIMEKMLTHLQNFPFRQTTLTFLRPSFSCRPGFDDIQPFFFRRRRFRTNKLERFPLASFFSQA